MAVRKKRKRKSNIGRVQTGRYTLTQLRSGLCKAKESLTDFFRDGEILSLALFVTGPVVMYLLVELLNNNRPVKSFSTLQIYLNLFWYYLLFFGVLMIAGRLKLAAGISSSLVYVIGTANHYVYAFRGRTIFPGDLMTLGTAANVAESYDYTPSEIQIITFMFFLMYTAALLVVPRQKKASRPPVQIVAGAAIIAGTYFYMFFGTGFLEESGIVPSMWTTRGNGLFLNFTISLKYSNGAEPEGYGEEALEQVAARYSSDAGVLDEGAPENVIVIMNESFADLADLGSFPANDDWMPFYRTISGNAVTGRAYSSVFGGTTANSEYEFLTGHTTRFFPPGAVPYQLYVKEEEQTLVSQMKGLGYTCVAMHPYLPSGWNRVPVYRDMGFDTVMFKDDFKNRQFMRNYVTDQCNYENVIDIVEGKAEGENLFIFNISMQNHSSYTVEYRGLPKTVWLSGELEDKFPTVDQFLSLMRESDSALEYLMEYFGELPEKTVILLFGDHQPQVSQSFFEYMLGGKLDTLDAETMQSRQKVPFFIWANYEIEEADGLELSLNYLAALLMETSGLPMTGYQKYLMDLSEAVPVINTVGIIDDDGNSVELERELADEKKRLVEEYELLQYCAVFDRSAWPEDFFVLS